MSVLHPDDFADAGAIVEHHSSLAIAIVYATTAFLPGYTELRSALAPAIVTFCQKCASAPQANDGQDIVTLQTLTILYHTARPTALERTWQPRVDGEVGFWFVKSCCESFAQKASLYRTADELGTAFHREQDIASSDPMIARYLWWLWLYANSHK